MIIGDIVTIIDPKFNTICGEFNTGIVISISPFMIVSENEWGAFIWIPLVTDCEVCGYTDTETLNRCISYIPKSEATVLDELKSSLQYYDQNAMSHLLSK
jgi:hypothetical protein